MGQEIALKSSPYNNIWAIMALTSSEISELAAGGMPAEYIAMVAALEERRDAAKRSKNRECVRRHRERRRNITPPKCNITDEGVIQADTKCNITPRDVILQAAKPLKVSRNSHVYTIKVSKEEDTVSVSLPSVEIPSLSAAAEVPQVPDFAPPAKVPSPEVQPNLITAAQTPKAVLYALAKAKFGERGGALVGRWFKQYPDHEQLLAFLRQAVAAHPEEPQAMIGFVVLCIKQRTTAANQRELDRKLVESWYPERGRLLPRRDHSDPQTRFYLTHPNETRKVWMNTRDVYRKYDDFCQEHDIVEG